MKREGFQLPAQTQYLEIIEQTNLFSSLPNDIQRDKG